MNKKLKIILYVLIILLIAIVSFFGVYSKNSISYDNLLPDYLLSSELTGKRISYLKINEGTEEKIYDKDGKEVDNIPEGANEEEYRKEEIKINSEESLNTENYKKVKEIFEGRFKDLGVEEYTFRLNEQTGEIVVELPDKNNTDELLQYLLLKGDFSVTDSKDGTMLLEKSDIKDASVTYSNTGTGSVDVHLRIRFNKDGAKKLEEVSRNYLKVETDEEHNHEEGEEENTEDDNQKKVTMTIEGNEILTTYFGEEMKEGELALTLGSGTDNETVLEYAKRAQVYAMLLNNEELPVRYTATASEYIQNPMSEDMIYVIIGIVSLICVITIIYMIFKFKVNGIISSYALISAVAMLLLMIRYTKTTISLGAGAAMLVLAIVEAYFMIKILRNIQKDSSYEKVKSITLRTYLNEIDVIIVLLIIAVIFTFMPEAQIFSIGMTLFYGIISIAIANIVFMRGMLVTRYKD